MNIIPTSLVEFVNIWSIILFIVSCDNGYVELIKNSKYYYYEESTPMKFSKARKTCEKYGGDLATFHNEEEREHFLKEKYHDYWFGFKKIIGKFTFVRKSGSYNYQHFNHMFTHFN